MTTNNKLKQMYVKKEKESHSDEINSNNHHKGMVATDKPHEHTKHSQHHRQQQQQHHQEPISSQYSVNLHFDTIVPEAGRNTALTISVAEKSGTPVREFEFVHNSCILSL